MRRMFWRRAKTAMHPQINAEGHRSYGCGAVWQGFTLSVIFCAFCGCIFGMVCAQWDRTRATRHDNSSPVPRSGTARFAAVAGHFENIGIHTLCHALRPCRILRRAAAARAEPVAHGIQSDALPSASRIDWQVRSIARRLPSSGTPRTNLRRVVVSLW